MYKLLLLLLFVICECFELKQFNMTVDKIAVHKHIYASNNNIIYNISTNGATSNNITIDSTIKSIDTYDDKLFILDTNNIVTYYGKFNFSLKIPEFDNYIIKYDACSYLLIAIGTKKDKTKENQTIVVYYDLYHNGSYIVHYIIDGLYISSSVTDSQLLLSIYNSNTYIHVYTVFGNELVINTSVILGEITSNDELIVEVDYQIFLYNYKGELISTFDYSNEYNMFDPIIYKDYIIYNELPPSIQFINLNGTKVFQLEYNYKCVDIPHTKIDIYGNIISYLCGILNLWINSY
jgi:hypothetical protein